MVKSIFVSILLGIAVYVITAIFTGRYKANYLPGGVVVGGWFIIDPWYIGVIFGLVGHIVAAMTITKIKN